MSTPSPSNVGHGVKEEGGGVKEEGGKATKTKTVKAEDAGAFIKIKLQCQTADDDFYRLHRDVKLERLMDMYCAKHSLQPMAVRFLDAEGRPIRPDQTPGEVGLKDDDTINVVLSDEETKTTVKAEDGGGGSPLINIKVQSQTADDVSFRIRRDVKLRRVMDMYCGKHSLNLNTVLFLGPDGGYIRQNQTPDEVGLEDGDKIHIVLTQTGGAAAREPAGRSA